MAEILIIEDDLRVGKLIKRGVEEQGYTTDMAYDGWAGLKMVKAQDYQLIITDIVLPKLDGLELSKKVREIKPNIPILMLTALGTTDDKIEGFDAGADDYLVKPFEMRELFVRIKALLRRNASSPVNSTQQLKYKNLEMDLFTKRVSRNGKEIDLTPKEFNLLEFLLKNPERVLSRAEIAKEVWDTHFDTGTNFIDVYINYLRKKIDKEFQNKLIHTKSGMGFILTNK